MEIEVIFKIAAIGILTAVVGQILQHQGKGEIATLATLAGLVLVLVTVMNMVSGLFETMKGLFNLY